MGPATVKLAASAGLFLDPWQRFAVDALLKQREDGAWASQTGLLIMPRQNGKGAVDEAIELAWILLCDFQVVLHTAHHAKTAKSAFNKMRARIEGCDWLKKRLAKDRSGGIRTANGEWGITFATGQQIIYATRTAGTARGLTVEGLVYDECQELTDDELAAIDYTTDAVDNPLSIWTGSAPNASQEVLRRVMGGCREGMLDYTFLEWSVSEDLDPLDLDDPVLWAQANPGMGIRLSVEKIRDKRGKASDEAFSRERLGIVNLQGSNPFAGAWNGLKDEVSGISGPVTMALEVSQDREWSAIGAAGLRPDGLTHVECVKYGRGTSWVVDWLAERSHPVVVQPTTEAGSLVADLEKRRVKVITASQQDYRDACGQFHDSVLDSRSTRHLGQSPLDISATSARKKVSGDAWVWDRRSPKTDISPLAAVTLAAWGSKRKKRAGNFVSF